MWENLKWRKVNWYRVIVQDLETANALGVGDKLIIIKTIDAVVDDYELEIKDCPPTAPLPLLNVYDKLTNYGFKSPWLEETLETVRQTKEFYLHALK